MRHEQSKYSRKFFVSRKCNPYTHHVFDRRTRGIDVTRKRMELSHSSIQTTVKLQLGDVWQRRLADGYRRFWTIVGKMLQRNFV
jgi:hypothetical protein